MIEFVRPLYLLLAPIAIYFTWRVTRGSLADLSRSRARFALGLRIVILCCLIGVMSGARAVRNASEEAVVFCFDVSDSIPKSVQTQMLRYVNQALAGMKPDQKAGVVVFGSDAVVELRPGPAKKVNRVYSVPRTAQTDIAQAIGLGMALFPERAARKIVLLTDGSETMGRAIDQAVLAASDDISIDTVPFFGSYPHEVLVDRLSMSVEAKVGEPFDLNLVLFASEPSVGTVRILRNGSPVMDRRVELTKGRSVLSFRQSVEKAGGYEYRSVLDVPADTSSDNNAGVGFVRVRGKPRVLYIEGVAGQAKYLSNALKTQEMELANGDSSLLPRRLAELMDYDAVILSDIPAWNLTPEHMLAVSSAVKNVGMGLVMVGGENSFGAGGYYDTPLEEALPVEMSVRKKKVLPSLTVALVMDKSGSMGATEDGRTKIQLANDGASSVVRLLQPIDKVSVIVCHDYPVVAVPLSSAADKDKLYDQISTIRAEGGGIMVFSSLMKAHEVIKSSGTRQRHIILLADGADCDEQEGVVPLVKQMASEKITVSVVAIGDGKDVPFLRVVAYYGKGQFYLAKAARDLRAIFTKDVLTVSKSLIVEEPFTPRHDPDAPELAGVGSGGLPPLLGYVMTAAKPAARVPMKSHKGDPVLAFWRYGLGQSAAFTPDCKARWSAHWLGWPDYPKFWSQVVRGVMRRSPPTVFQSIVDVESGKGLVRVDAVDEDGEFINNLALSGSVVAPDMNAARLNLEQTGPGRYEASFPAEDVGNYVVSIRQEAASGESPELSVLSIPYPPEYKFVSPNTSLLRRLAQQTGGRFDPDPSEVFGGHFRPKRTYSDLWRLLTFAAIFLLPVDIAVRRVAISSELLRELMGKIARVSHSPTRTAPAPQSVEHTVDSLLTAKKTGGNRRIDPTIAQELRHRLDGEKPAATSPLPGQTDLTESVDLSRSSDPTDTTSRLLDAKRKSKER